MKTPSVCPNILLVEDNQVNQLVTRNQLQKLGMNVSVAQNGQEAVAMISSKAYHLILMDLQMPVMDGFESTMTIRAMDDLYFQTIPILAFTASGMIEVINKAKLYGMTDFVCKPILLEELRDKINRYILPTNRRPLFIDFDLYTEGDEEFKNELLELLKDNLQELMHSFIKCLKENDPSIFVSTFHKIKPTITILADSEFSSLLERIKIELSVQKDDDLQRSISLFNTLCTDIIDSLEMEADQKRMTILNDKVN